MALWAAVESAVFFHLRVVAEGSSILGYSRVFDEIGESSLFNVVSNNMKWFFGCLFSAIYRDKQKH